MISQPQNLETSDINGIISFSIDLYSQLIFHIKAHRLGSKQSVCICTYTNMYMYICNLPLMYRSNIKYLEYQPFVSFRASHSQAVRLNHSNLFLAVFIICCFSAVAPVPGWGYVLWHFIYLEWGPLNQ